LEVTVQGKVLSLCPQQDGKGHHSLVEGGENSQVLAVKTNICWMMALKVEEVEAEEEAEAEEEEEEVKMEVVEVEVEVEEVKEVEEETHTLEVDGTSYLFLLCV